MALLFGCGVMAMVGGNMEVVTRNIRYSWSFVFYVMAGVELSQALAMSSLSKPS
jgi:PAT family beta-lactamase induction signal transducer AmpG